MRFQMQLLAACFLILFTISSASAISIVVDVDARQNSSSGGSGLVTGLSLVSGQLFSVSADEGDLWNAGTLPRWSNADGLIGDLFATGSDHSGQTADTLIGKAFDNLTLYGLTAPHGSLVGEINGVYSLLGTNFLGNAWATGDLFLYYWDSNNYDNTEYITVSINDDPTPVPEPGTLLLLGSGLAGLALYRRRTNKA